MWNYRIAGNPKTKEFQIVEVHYENNGKVGTWIECGKPELSSDDLGDLRSEIEGMLEAFDKPVLSIVGDELRE